MPFPEPRFVDNEDGTVRDNLTGLIWLKNANCFGGHVHGDQALARLAITCQLALNGLTDGSTPGDWRLI